MKLTCLATCLTLLLASFSNAGLITSSGAGYFARNNDSNQGGGNDIQDLNNGDLVGYLFTVGSSNISVSSLGIWDGPNSGTLATAANIGDGLVADSTISIWNSTGIVATASVSTGAAPITGEFVYAPLASPVILTAGVQYYIAASYTDGGNSIYNAGADDGHGGLDPETAPTTMPGVMIDGNRFGNGPGGTGSGHNSIDAYVGPSAEFTAVPEPSGFLFLGLAFTGALAWKRRVALADAE